MIGDQITHYSKWLAAVLFAVMCLTLTAHDHAVSLPGRARPGRIPVQKDNQKQTVVAIDHSPFPLQSQRHHDMLGDLSWHQYVETPGNMVVDPMSVVPEMTRGDVKNAASLLVRVNGSSNDSQPAILTRWKKGDEEPVLVLDFGRNVVGLVVIEFENSKTTREKALEEGIPFSEKTKARPGIRLSFSETLEFLGEKSDFTRSYNIGKKTDKVTEGSDQILVPQGPSTWTAQLGCQFQDPKQVCSDGLHGFRYVRISLSALTTDYPRTVPTGQVRIKSVRLRWSAYLGRPESFRGWFECSDVSLTRYWYQGVYTNDLCTDKFRANDTEPRGATSSGLVSKLVLHDGAKRDRDPYVGDLAISGLTAYLTRSVVEAVSNVLRDLANHQRSDGWIPPASIFHYNLKLFDYPLWWVVCVYNHVLYTGDAIFAKEMYPVIKNVLDGYYISTMNTTLGLIQKGMGIHSSDGYGDYAFLPRQGIVTYYNALYIIALKNAAHLAAHPIINAYSNDGQRWKNRAHLMSAVLRTHAWDPNAGAFFDGQCEDRKNNRYYCPTHAQDGNSLAILAGVADPVEFLKSTHFERHTVSGRSILSHLTNTTFRPWGNAFYDSAALSRLFPDRVYPFISHFEVLARFLTPGFAPSAIDQLRRTYGTMLTQGPGTFWEGLSRGGRPYEGGYTSMAHGWSTGVVSALTNRVLGVEPAEQDGWGWVRWRVRPLAWEGMVKHQNDRNNIDGSGDSFEHIPISWARGTVLTMNGRIGVMWNMTESRSGASKTQFFEYVLSVSAPRRTMGEVWVPVPIVASDGKKETLRVTVFANNQIIMDDNSPLSTEAKLDARMGYMRISLDNWDGDNLVRVFRVKAEIRL